MAHDPSTPQPTRETRAFDPSKPYMTRDGQKVSGLPINKFMPSRRFGYVASEKHEQNWDWTTGKHGTNAALDLVNVPDAPPSVPTAASEQDRPGQAASPHPEGVTAFDPTKAFGVLDAHVDAAMAAHKQAGDQWCFTCRKVMRSALEAAFVIGPVYPSELQALEKAASPGPWFSEEGEYYARHPRISNSAALICDVGNSCVEYQEQWQADAAFIVAIRNSFLKLPHKPNSPPPPVSSGGDRPEADVVIGRKEFFPSNAELTAAHKAFKKYVECPSENLDAILFGSLSPALQAAAQVRLAESGDDRSGQADAAVAEAVIPLRSALAACEEHLEAEAGEVWIVRRIMDALSALPEAAARTPVSGDRGAGTTDPTLQQQACARKKVMSHHEEYIRKSFIIKAIQVQADLDWRDLEVAPAWFEGRVRPLSITPENCVNGWQVSPTAFGLAKAFPGDWITRHGSIFEVYRDAEFHSLFENSLSHDERQKCAKEAHHIALEWNDPNLAAELLKRIGRSPSSRVVTVARA